MKAVWQETVLAESDATIVVEGNHYFPPEALRPEFFQASKTRSTCPWKGEAHYYDVVVGDAVNTDAAWFYPETKEKAASIRAHVAFWRGVEVVD